MTTERKIYEKTRANGQKAELFVVTDDDGDSYDVEVRIDGEEYETGFPRLEGSLLRVGKVGFDVDAAEIFRRYKAVVAELRTLPREEMVITSDFRTIPYSQTLAAKLGPGFLSHDDEEEAIHGVN